MRIKLHQDKDAILKVLNSADVEKKLKVLEKLDGINERDCIKILIKTLEDKSWCMREKAAYKLAEYGTRVSSRLKRLLKKGYWYTRASACLALGEIGDIQAAESIIELLDDENPTVQKEASNALVKLARKKPEKFAAKLAEIDLQASEFRTVMFLVERADIELYGIIKEYLVDERDA